MPIIEDTREFDYPLGYKSTKSTELIDILDNLTCIYVKGIVKEVISNPLKWMELEDKEGIKNKEKYTYLFRKPNEDQKIDDTIRNDDLFDVMPPNSILCYISEGRGKNSMPEKAVIAFPFFPPHISLPLKPGEHIWLLKDSSMWSTSYSFYYWMCRITTFRQVDDINYTFLPQHERVFSGLKHQKEQGLEKISLDDKISISSYVENINKELPANVSNSSIIASAHAYKQEFTSEPIPRKFKDCGDLLLQGSNNAHLQFTTEKFRPLKEDYLNDSVKQNIFTNPNHDNNKGNFRRPAAGALDLAVGRDKLGIENIKAASANKTSVSTITSGFNAILGSRDELFQSYESHTLDKINESLNEDNDIPRNAFSRLYMSMDGAIDKVFQIKEAETFPYQEGASLVAYSDHTRIFAEETLRIANINNVADSKIFGMIEIAKDGQITLQAGEGDAGAKIILRPNGNIILKPGPKGLLHLGGDESDTTLSVCGVPTTIDAENGTANPEPIKSSLGGELFRGGNPDNHTLNDVIYITETAALAIGGPSSPPVLGESGLEFGPAAIPNSAPDGTASSKVVIKA